MLLHGDELGRTQQGNNNAYCQDNEISWINWSPESIDEGLIQYASRLIHLRKQHPVFRRRRFFQGHDPRGTGGKPEIAWLRPDGAPMDDNDWTAGSPRSLAVFLDGGELDEVGPRGEPVRDDSFVLLINAGDESVDFVLPKTEDSMRWIPVLDTAVMPDGDPAREDGQPADPGSLRTVIARGLMLLRQES